MKNIFIIFLLSICSIIFSIEPRDFVATIECKPNKLISDAMDLIAHEYSTIANKFSSFRNGWYGTGFLVKTKTGNIVLITNRHVAGLTDSMIYTFETSNDIEIKIDGNFPIHQDKYLDLAIIDLPDDKLKNLSYLTLDADFYFSDGYEVYSAGYPGLFGKPSWQITKGIVSNKNTSLNKIIDSSYTTLIQHTSAIDGGSSGGPLLIKIDDKWIPIGINTWTVTNRNEAYFAIPIDKVNLLVDDYIASTSDKSKLSHIEDKLKDCIDNTILLLNKDEWLSDRSHWDISIDLTLEYGLNSFISLMNVNESIIDEVGSRFGSQSAFQLLRESTLWWSWKTLAKQGMGNKLNVISYTSISEPIIDGILAHSVVSSGNKELNFSYIYSRGNWYLHKIEFPIYVNYLYKLKDITKDNENSEKKIINYYATSLQVGFAPTYINSDILENGWKFRGSIMIPGNGRFSIPISLEYRVLPELSNNKNISTDTKTGMFDFGLSYSFPIKTKKSLFVPFVEATVGFGAGNTTNKFDEYDGESDEIDIFGSLGYGGGLKYINIEKKLGFFFSVSKETLGSLFYDKWSDTYLDLGIIWVIDYIHI